MLGTAPPTGQRRPRASGPASAGRLVARFTVAGVLVMVGLAVAIALVARTRATEVATNQVSDITWVTAKGVVEPLLTDQAVAGDPAALAALDVAMHRYVLSGSLVRVKIWSADGRVVYSDAPVLIGQRFDLEDNERGALLEGGRDADVSDLSRPENNQETQFGRLLEVHVGVRSTSGTPMLYEAYFRYDAVAEASWDAWRTFAPLSIGALLILELVQVPFAFGLARRLQRREQQRERLLRHAVDASTAERRRIAGDLHDGVVQELAGITYALDASRLQAPTNGDHPAVVTEAARRLRGSIGALRTLLVDIYPPNLAEEGLGPALQELVGGLERRGLSVQADFVDVDSARPNEAALLYRPAQEAIRNVVSHSAAEHVDMTVARSDRSWLLTVDDDGRGFDTDAHTASGSAGHLGLRSLGDLFDDAGGTLTVRAAPGAGTRVEVEVPIR